MGMTPSYYLMYKSLPTLSRIVNLQTQELVSLLIERQVNLNLINDTLNICKGSESEIESLIRFIKENDPSENELLNELVQVANHKILGRLNDILTTE